MFIIIFKTYVSEQINKFVAAEDMNELQVLVGILKFFLSIHVHVSYSNRIW